MHNVIRYLELGLVQMRATSLSLGRVTLFAELVQSARQFVDDSHRVPVGRIATVPHQRFLYCTKFIMILYYYGGNTKNMLESKYTVQSVHSLYSHYIH